MIKFPPDFFFGTSTAAAQVETATNHPWKGLVAKDGYVFEKTTEHEKRRAEDAEYIVKFGTVYRCGVDWSRLQLSAFAPFEEDVIREYQDFFELLQSKEIKIMFVMHHFMHPNWFEEKGGWAKEQNILAFVDYANQCIEYFGKYVYNWNIFNEPNVFALNGYVTGDFPPHKKNIFTASRVIKNMGRAHQKVFPMIKNPYPNTAVGISFNTCYFKGLSFFGKLYAGFTDWWFTNFCRKQFEENMDFWGISYYAYVPFDPLPITEIDRPSKLASMGLPHDKMWGYLPEGLLFNLRRFHKWYNKPIVITENGICTDDSNTRIDSIKDYLKICHQAMGEGIDLKGYIHWCTWDNFEWALGPTYRFGLVRVDLDTMERTMTKAGEFYSKVAEEKGFDENLNNVKRNEN